MIADMPGRLVSPILVGRAVELAAASQALDASVAGAPVHLLVSGEAGVGKTRFVAEFADGARERGVLVLRGESANVGDGGLPYAPVVEILRDLARTLDAAELERVVGVSGPDLARLVPALAPSPLPVPTQTEWLQARLLEAMLGLLHRLAERAPTVLVVEDIHWADPATREMLAFLVRNLRRERVLLLMTYRSDELHRRHPLLPWLADVERSGRIERIQLERLGLPETMQLVGAILGTEPERGLAERIHRRSDGNPFFAEELLAATDDAGHAGRVSAGLRDVLLARLASVPEGAQRLLGVTAVAGRRIEHDLLAEVVDSPETDLIEDLRVAVGNQLLVSDVGPTGGDGYAFRHALVQEVAYDELLPGERRRLHRACAEALARRQALPGAPAAAHWAQLAHHWASARDDIRAFEAWLRAAEESERTFAFEAALHQYERALELWPGLPDAAAMAGFDHTELLSRAGRAAQVGGDLSRAAALRREAVAGHDATRDLVRGSVLREQLARSLWTLGDSAGALAASREAVEMMPVEPSTAERARVLSGYAQMLMLLDDWGASRELAEEAIAIARRVGAREAEGHALNSLGLGLSALGQCDESFAALRAALDIAVEVGNADDIGRAHVNLSDALFHCGLAHQAVEAVEDGIRTADAYGITSSYGAFIRHNGILFNFELGDWATADRLAREAVEVAQVGRHIDRYGLARWVPLLVATGDPSTEARLARLGELLEDAPVEAQFAGNYHASMAELALWQGRPADGLAECERGLEQLGGHEFPWHTVRLHRIAARAVADLAEAARAARNATAESAALSRLATLQVERARLIERSRPHQSERQAAETNAEAMIAAAEDGRAAGRDDPVRWRAARESMTALERPYMAAYAAYREAEASLAVGGRAAAVEPLREAAATAGRLGAQPLAAAIESLARRARIDLAGSLSRATATPPTPAAEPVPTDPYRLTRREREVLGLVALGRTNRQIADELFISENTAGVHVSNILGKLGVAGRTEAAAIAVRAGYAAPGD